MAESKDQGPFVAAAGTGINLALGVLYAWSIFKGSIKTSIDTGGPGAFSWDPAALNDPYAVCCLVFAFMMIVAGKCQDTFGPRITAIVGGVLVGVGFIWISQSTAYWTWVLGFGVLVGTGIAFGYSSATPPALKWYPPHKTGKVAGLVVSGFGLASVYIAPLSQYLLNNWGLQKAMLFFGVAFLVIVTLLAMALVNPPEGYVPKGFVCRRGQCDTSRTARATFPDIQTPPLAMIKTGSFWLLWVLYFIGAGAGLMVIGSVAGMAKKSLGQDAFLAVAILAVGNAGGRIAAGMLSDKIGRTWTLAGIFFAQAVLMFVAIPITAGGQSGNALQIVLLATFIGFNYGANLALFPSFTKDLWGIKNFGVNYGLVFSAWGLGGFVMSRVSQALSASTGTFATSFKVAGILLMVGTAMTFLVRDHKTIERKRIARQLAAAGAVNS